MLLVKGCNGDIGGGDEKELNKIKKD